MRLFDVRQLRALTRGVDCSGHMKALQSISSGSGHYGAGTEATAEVCRLHGGPQDLMMKATAAFVTLLTSGGWKEGQKRRNS